MVACMRARDQACKRAGVGPRRSAGSDMPLPCPTNPRPSPPQPQPAAHLGSISLSPGVGLGKNSCGSYLLMAGAVGDTPLQ